MWQHAALLMASLIQHYLLTGHLAGAMLYKAWLQGLLQQSPSYHHGIPAVQTSGAAAGPDFSYDTWVCVLGTWRAVCCVLGTWRGCCRHGVMHA